MKISPTDQMKKWMRLIESFETDDNTDQPVPDTDDSTAQSGRKATTRVDKTDPHVRHKTFDSEDPAYEAYVKFLVSNQVAQQNPHFPRIYTVNQTKEPARKAYTPWSMPSANKPKASKLIHVTVENLPITLTDYIGDMEFETYQTQSGQSVSLYVGFERIGHLAEVYLTPAAKQPFIDKIEAAKAGEYANDVTMDRQVQDLGDLLDEFALAAADPKNCELESYKEAILLLQHFMKTNPSVRGDLHASNIMIRMRNIPTLVLIDPVE